MKAREEADQKKTDRERITDNNRERWGGRVSQREGVREYTRALKRRRRMRKEQVYF